MRTNGAQTNDPWIDRNFEQSVRDTAYFLWEHDGQPGGMEKEYWFRVLDRCLRQREADQLLQKPPLKDEGVDLTEKKLDR